MLGTISVLIEDMPADFTALYSLLSAFGGAIVGSLIMYFAQKKLQQDERKIRYREKKEEAYGEILRIYRSNIFFREENYRWIFDHKEFNGKILPELTRFYLYLPIETQVNLDIIMDFEEGFLYDGFPDSRTEEVYSEKLKLVYDSISYIADEYKSFVKEMQGFN